MKGVPEHGWVAVAVIVLVVNGFGEEIGWRGFAWPRLRDSRSLLGAAAVLTIPWALWHVPLFWIDSGLRDFPPMAFPGFVLSLFAGSVVLGWLFDKSASVAVVALWHTMLNMATGTDGASAGAAVVSMLVVVFAVVIVQYERHAAGRNGLVRERQVDRDRPQVTGSRPRDPGLV
jgi:membrane protease YdiL (CAAX protease family)